MDEKLASFVGFWIIHCHGKEHYHLMALQIQTEREFITFYNSLN